MGRLIWICTGALLATACGAAASFPYRFYFLKPDSYSGKLIGNKPENDLSLTLCAPQPGKENRCSVMFTDAFVKMVTEYKQLQQDLKDCQKGR